MISIDVEDAPAPRRHDPIHVLSARRYHEALPADGEHASLASPFKADKCYTAVAVALICRKMNFAASRASVFDAA